MPCRATGDAWDFGQEVAVGARGNPRAKPFLAFAFGKTGQGKQFRIG